MNMKRKSGILLHISSLGGKYGIGNIGRDSRRFISFLKDSGFSAWQTLPVNSIGSDFSPYNAISSFAGNSLFIDPEELYLEGLITKEELNDEEEENCETVDYNRINSKRARLLRLAFSRFRDFDALVEFSKREASWLSDYATFMSLCDKTGSFPERLSEKELSDWRKTHYAEENYYKFEQFVFSKQWDMLRNYAKENKVSLIGDIPIYVALNSCDVWANPEIFNLDENFIPTEWSGCPPDSFSPVGQLWKTPTYNRDALIDSGYSWWISRLSRMGTMFDAIRLDHFRGFAAYWASPYGAENAAVGEWKRGLGKEFFLKVKDALPHISFIAEDLGFITEDVIRLRDETNIPGMRILQFAFDGNKENPHLPKNYIENSVAYTGTHDNNTLLGFIKSLPEETLTLARSLLGINDEIDLTSAFIRAVWASSSNLAIAPMQDFLNLPESARMNTPSTVNSRNWRWRMRNDCLTDDLLQNLLSLNREFSRI